MLQQQRHNHQSLWSVTVTFDHLILTTARAAPLLTVVRRQPSIVSCPAKEPHMSVKFDRFSLIVIGVVLAIVAAALVTVGRGEPSIASDYRTANAPETPVINAFLARRQNDIATFRQQYSARAMSNFENNGTTLEQQWSYTPDDSSRLRVLNAQVDSSDPNRAYVTIARDSYSGSLFGGSTYSYESIVPVVREDERWKIDSVEFFY